MKKFFKASKGKNPGVVKWTKENMVHVNWCMKNKNIFIAVQPRATDWEIEIRMGKTVSIDPNLHRRRSTNTNVQIL
jgi:ribosomal protein L24E